MRIIQIPHKVCAVNCMWNPVEDIYALHTGFPVPDHLFFAISGIGNFIYLKNGKMTLKRTVYWGNGITKKMYEFMSGVAGFEFTMKENLKFENMLKAVRKHIDTGIPVILGALDMYHLGYYEKFYHKFHIPIHHVLAVGYDEDGIFVLDCDRQEIQRIPPEDLEKSLDVFIPGYSGKNTFYTVTFKEKIPVETIAVEGFRKKARLNMNPPIGIMGIPGMRKLALEIENWHDELTSAEYRKCLMNMAEFSGFPPILPSKLSGYDNGDIMHMGGMNILSKVLYDTAQKTGMEPWKEAAHKFRESGIEIERITDEIADAVLSGNKITGIVPEIILRIANLQEKAYSLIIG